MSSDEEKFFELLGHKKETEIRAINPNKRDAIFSAFVHSKEEFTNTCEKNNHSKNVYAGLNERVMGGKSKEDVVSLNCILIDIDPIRRRVPADVGITDEELASGKTASTDEELKKALEKAAVVGKYLAEQNIEVGGEVMSGNGGQLLVPFSPAIEITDSNRSLVDSNLHNFGLSLGQKFNDEDTTIDPTVYELARITKVPGTLSIKGKNLPHRPHRLAVFLNFYGTKKNDELRRILLQPQKKEDTVKKESSQTNGEVPVIPIAIAKEIDHLMKSGKIIANSKGKIPAGQRHYAYLTLFGLLSQEGYMRPQISKAIQYLNRVKTEHPKPYEDVEEEIEQIKYPTQDEVPKEQFDEEAEKLERELFEMIGKEAKNDDEMRAELNRMADKRDPKTGKKVEVQIGSIVKIFSSYLARQDVFITLDDTGVLYRYMIEEGIYRAGAENWVRGRVQTMISGSKLESKVSRYLAEEVVSSIKRFTFIQRDKLTPPHRYTPFSNGIYDFDEKKLLPFTPNLFFTSKLAVIYNPVAVCPNIDKFLSEVLPQQTESLYELAGYVCKRSNPMQKAWLIEGGGNNGKSKFISLLSAMIGKENICAVPLQKLEGNRFAVAEMEDKYMNAVADLSSADMKTTGLFKSITGNDLVMAERKGQNPFKFEAFAKLVYSCNSIPDAVGDDSNAYYRRWILLTFNVDFTGREDRDILKKITTPEELSGFLSKSLNYMESAMERGSFTGELSTVQTRQLYIAKANSAKAFLDVAVIRNPEAITPKQEVWKNYMDFCKEKRLVSKTETAFGMLLKGEFGEAKIDKINSWLGLELPKTANNIANKNMFRREWNQLDDGKNDV